MSDLPIGASYAGTPNLDAIEEVPDYLHDVEPPPPLDAEDLAWQLEQLRENDAGETEQEADDRLIGEEVRRLRIRDSARRLYDAELRPPAEPPTVLTLRERLALPRPEITFRIAGWQPVNSRVILAAQYKAGKTTLVGNLIRSLVDGDPFLDSAHVEPVESATLLDFEMSDHQIDGWLDDQGIVNDDHLRVVAMRGKASAFDIIDPTVRTEWADRLRGTKYLVVDCLRPILDALGLDEHRDAGRFLVALDALMDEAGIPECNVVHHMGHSGERSRGDSRLRDWPDVEWRLVRQDDDPASPRFVSAFGRDVEVLESAIGYDPTNRHMSLVGGTRKEAKVDAALPDVIAYLGAVDDPPSMRAIQRAFVDSEHGRDTVRKAVKAGVRSGVIVVDQTGGAHLHRLAPTGTASDANPIPF